MTVVSFRSSMPVPAEVLSDFHADGRNLERISPPVPRVRLVSPPKETELGDLQVVQLSLGPLRTIWNARVTRFERGRLLEDVQESGPYLNWRHEHRFEAAGPGASFLHDRVRFRLWPTPVGEFLEYSLVRPFIIAMFAIRHRKTRALLGHSKS